MYSSTLEQVVVHYQVPGDDLEYGRRGERDYQYQQLDRVDQCSTILCSDRKRNPGIFAAGEWQLYAYCCHHTKFGARSNTYCWVLRILQIFNVSSLLRLNSNSNIIQMYDPMPLVLSIQIESYGLYATAFPRLA
jgi:hypothetical protein